MKNYQKKDIGLLRDLNQHVFALEGTPLRLEGKAFLKERIGLSSVEVSLNKDEPGTGMPFVHRHKNNEETYIFIGGKGEMLIDGERFPVGEGTVLSVQPQARRAWRNTGDEALYYVVIQAPANGLDVGIVHDAELVEETVPWGK